jgi:hypothetical protein
MNPLCGLGDHLGGDISWGEVIGVLACLHVTKLTKSVIIIIIIIIIIIVYCNCAVTVDTPITGTGGGKPTLSFWQQNTPDLTTVNQIWSSN